MSTTGSVGTPWRKVIVVFGVCSSALCVLLFTSELRAGWTSGYQSPGICAPDYAAYLVDLQTFDDGSGPSLYATGAFHTVGDVISHGIARWDGSKWHRVGSGFDVPDNSGLTTMGVYDDGTGPALYVSGRFLPEIANNIAKLDGDTWVPLGTGLESSLSVTVFVMKSFDLGDGEALYVGGNFETAGGVPVQGMAKWDGSSWSAMGNAQPMRSLTVADYGSGPTLFGSNGSRVYQWDGTNWIDLTGPAPEIFDGRTVYTFDDGTGPAIYTDSLGKAWKYDGATWTALPDPPYEVPEQGFGSIGTFDDGSGPAIYGVVSSPVVGTNHGIRLIKSDGFSWTPVGDPIWPGAFQGIEVFDDGGGAKIYAAGRFGAAGNAGTAGIAKLDGTTWTSVSPGLGMGNSGNYSGYGVSVLRFLELGAGPELHAGGAFHAGGPAAAMNIAKLTAGPTWEVYGSGDILDATQFLHSDVQDVVVFDDGTGPAVYAAGAWEPADIPSAYVAKWDGNAWVGVGGGVDQSAFALAVFDDGSGEALYAGGLFSNAGGVPAKHIARWDGTSWSAIGDGLSGSVQAMVVYDDGTGPALYVGGDFVYIGDANGPVVNRIAKWDGTSWSALGTGLDNAVYSLAVLDECGGPVLIAGQRRTVSGGEHVINVHRWDGSTWTTLGSGATPEPNQPERVEVSALATVGSCTDALLFAGGNFVEMDGMPVGRLAVWDGTSWSPVPEGVDGKVEALAAVDQGDKIELYVGGEFSTAGGRPACHIAHWSACRIAIGAGTCPCSDPSAGSATFDAGVAGCVESIDGGASLCVEPGDIDQSVTISVDQVAVNQPNVDLTVSASPGLGVAVSLYDFQPDGFTFASPTTLTTRNDVTAYNDNQRERIDLFTVVPPGNNLEPVGAACCIEEDPPGTLIATCTVDIDHFSTYGMVVPQDSDNDGIFDLFDGEQDNCPTAYNPDQTDTDGNGVGDCCDSAWSGFVDDNGDGVYDLCLIVPAAPMTDPDSLPKSRYLSLVPGNAGLPMAIRVVPHVLPGFQAWDGTPLWVGPPVAFAEEDSSQPGLTFMASALSCEPYYQDWSTIDLLYVFGGEIIPEGTYYVQTISAEAGSVEDEALYSSVQVLTTGAYGDVVAPFAGDGSGTTQPDFTDISSIVSKFLADPGAPIKARAQLQPNTALPWRPIDFNDIAEDVSAFLGDAYPYAGPCTCPSSVGCGSIPCHSDSECDTGFCVGATPGTGGAGSCIDACGRCTP